MEQEQRFIETLARVERFAIDPTGALILYAGDTEILRARRH